MVNQNKIGRGRVMRRSGLLIATLVFLNSAAQAIPLTSVKCMGGDGPNPLTDVSDNLGIGVEVLPTEGSVQEFLFWSNKQTVAYRNDYGRIYSLPLRGGRQIHLANSRNPLSSIKDDNNRFLSLRGRATVLDTESSPLMWRSWPHYREIKHLYWHRFLGRESLFSVGASFYRPRQQQIEVLSFSSRGIKPHICNLIAPQGQIFYLGEGHVYPYVFLYTIKKTGDNTQVNYFNIQIEGELLGKPTCLLYKSGQYSTVIPGNVTEVYQFPELMEGNHNMFVVKSDHPEKNFLWDDGTYGCRYYQFGEREPMVLNPRQPILTTWDDQDGLSIIYPRKTLDGQPLILRLLGNKLMGPVRKEHMVLSDDGRQLFVAARLKDPKEGRNRKLIRIELPQF
ncbi:MAG: hypothetical protein EB078_01930 [Proteobacteria bacterium]|nr:hypothetical protein [Pseudomonadota bacterium]NDC23461.1 hypothetical protein [Pseudomonadota bacterium]NDD03640.1 hypothetical protein [Pseudomonadota bacterium]NDG26065.1 hypothetical protein [Pseudomonadota bacterium]